MTHDRAMRTALFFCLLALAGCGSSNDAGVGGVTRGEADALNAAAEKLDTPPPEPLVGNRAGAR